MYRIFIAYSDADQDMASFMQAFLSGYFGEHAEIILMGECLSDGNEADQWRSLQQYVATSQLVYGLASEHSMENRLWFAACQEAAERGLLIPITLTRGMDSTMLPANLHHTFALDCGHLDDTATEADVQGFAEDAIRVIASHVVMNHSRVSESMMAQMASHGDAGSQGAALSASAEELVALETGIAQKRAEQEETLQSLDALRGNLEQTQSQLNAMRDEMERLNVARDEALERVRQLEAHEDQYHTQFAEIEEEIERKRAELKSMGNGASNGVTAQEPTSLSDFILDRSDRDDKASEPVSNGASHEDVAEADAQVGKGNGHGLNGHETAAEDDPQQLLDAGEVYSESSGGVLGAGADPEAFDITAYVPKRFQRGRAANFQIIMHRPQERRVADDMARTAHPRMQDATPSSFDDTDAAAVVSLELFIDGAKVQTGPMTALWKGAPIQFPLSVVPEAGATDVSIMARVFINDIEIGIIPINRPVSGRAMKAISPISLQKYKKVFVSYSGRDHAEVAPVFRLYDLLGIKYFDDDNRAADNSDRSEKEIGQCDLFYLCWSSNAADSHHVKKELYTAYTRRQKDSKARPNITVHMLEEPPFAPHPSSVDQLHWDSFLRAAHRGFEMAE